MTAAFHSAKQIINLLLLISLLMALTSCGTSLHSSTTATQPQHPATQLQHSATTKPEATTTTSLASLLVPNKDNLAINMDGLHIQATKGFHCSGVTGAPGYDYNLVLASDRLTYNQSEIQQMSAYFHSAQIPIPPTFRWAEGTNATQQANPSSQGCSISLQITNTGTTTIQIPQVALRLKNTPVPNTFIYWLINLCSFLSPAEWEGRCVGFGAGPTSCGIFSVSLFLGGSKMGDAVGNLPNGGTDPSTGNACPALAIAPQQSTEIDINAYGPAFVYTVIPELTLITSQGQQTLTLPTFIANLAFSNQFPCYDLRGNTFVPPSQADQHVVCM
jgi:hypothetical protein